MPLDTPPGPQPNQLRVHSMHHEVYVLYRPVEVCRTCLAEGNAPDQKNTSLPDVCPHTQKTEYNNLLQKVVDGTVHIAQANETTLKTGQVQVSVRYQVVSGLSSEVRPPRPKSL